MTATATRPRKRAAARRPRIAEPARGDGLLRSVPEVATAYGYTLQTIADTLCAVELDPDGEPLAAVFRLQGTNHYGGPAFGRAQIGQLDRTRWMVADSHGWLSHEFPTLPAAIAALTDPATCKALREYTDLIARMHEVTRQVHNFPPVADALPNYWQPPTPPPDQESET